MKVYRVILRNTCAPTTVFFVTHDPFQARSQRDSLTSYKYDAVIESTEIDESAWKLDG